MSKSSSHRSSPPRRHAPYRRWPVAEKAALLAAFSTSRQSAVAYCRAAGVPLATFTYWQREARQSSARPVFARVALAAADAHPAAAGAAPLGRVSGIRAVVQNGTGATIALDGLEPATARELVAVLLAAVHPIAR
jgi:transposase-like protein